MQETEIDWEILKRLRRSFLANGPSPGVYWENEDDLTHYHETFATRIGWKWDNVLEEAIQTGFSLRSSRLIDWGCGSGIATLRVLAKFGAERFEKVSLWDHSSLACRFAQQTILKAYPDLEVEIATGPDFSNDQDVGKTLVLLSHTLNELGTDTRKTLSESLKRAAQVLLVEPGDHAASSKLSKLRDALRDDFRIVAPCTHCKDCPMLEEEHARHWCHFFGKPPVDAFTDGFWARFSQTLEIDLRSLPYSYLVLDNKALAPEARDDSRLSRLIGRPRQFKGYTRLLSCDAAGLRELELQKRDDKQLWKTLKKGPVSNLFEWEEIESSSNRLKKGHSVES